MNHCCKVIRVSESSGPTLDVLDDVIQAFENGIGVSLVEIIEYLIPVAAEQSAKLLYISDGEPHLHGEIASPSRGFSLIVTD